MSSKNNLINVFLQIITFVATFATLYLLKIVNLDFLKNIILIYSIFSISLIFDFGINDLFFWRKISRNKLIRYYIIHLIIFTPLYVIYLHLNKIGMSYLAIFLIGYMYIVLSAVRKREGQFKSVILLDNYQYIILFPISFFCWFVEIHDEYFLLGFFLFISFISFFIAYYYDANNVEYEIDDESVTKLSYFNIFINKGVLTLQVNLFKILIENYLGAAYLVQYQILLSIIGKVQSISSSYNTSLMYLSGNIAKFRKILVLNFKIVLIYIACVVFTMPFILSYIFSYYNFDIINKIGQILIIILVTVANCLSVIPYLFFTSSLRYVKFNTINSTLTLFITLISFYVFKDSSWLIYILLISGSIVNFILGYGKIYSIYSR